MTKKNKKIDKNKNINKYISLQEAVKHCNYSQEYLSLRARQGKLRAIKIGRNWVTKKSWVKKYEKVLAKYRIASKKAKKTQRKKRIQPAHIVKVRVMGAKKVLPPENLPIGELDGVFQVKPARRKLKFHFAFLLGLVLIFIIISGILDKNFFQKSFCQINPYIKIAAKESNIVLVQLAGLIKQSSVNFVAGSKKIFCLTGNVQVIKGVSINDIAVDDIKVFQEYSDWLINTSRAQIKGFIRIFNATSSSI